MSEQHQETDTMLALFCTDLKHHATLIGDSLHLPDAPQVWEGARQSAHAIWGSAKLLELPEVAELARVMRDNFHISQALGETRKNQLHQATKWLLELADTPEQSFYDWLQQQLGDLQSLHQSLITPLDAQESLTTAAVVNDASPQETTPSPLPTLVPSSSSIDLNKVDNSLLDLFLSELEAHNETLNSGLLALEKNPRDKSQLQALMRSAHSIKGGARVVGLNILVGLAHHMEDGFVAAQQGQWHLTAEHIDFLLKVVDSLTRITLATKHKDLAALAQLEAEIQQQQQYLQNLHTGNTTDIPALSPPVVTSPIAVPTASPPATVPSESLEPEVIHTQPHPTTEAVPVSSPSNPTEADRVVRVSANKIERLMGLTGEVTVSARWLPPFAGSLLSLKRTQVEISNQLEKLQEKLASEAPLLLKELQLIREKNKDATHFLSEKLNQLEVFSSTLSTHSDRLYREMIGVRMRPFADGVKALPRMVRDLARQLNKQVEFEIVGQSVEVDLDILEKLDAPLNHLLRNALDHGLEDPATRKAAGKSETGHLRLEAGHRSGMLIITLTDDGCGVELQALREKVIKQGLASADVVQQLSEAELMEFLFLPGFSTQGQVTEISGRGIGLDVVRSMVQKVSGVVRAESDPGKGMCFHLELPLTLSVLRTFLVEIAGEPYAFPLAKIDRCLLLPPDEIALIEERQYFRFAEQNIALINIHDVLELKSTPPSKETISVVIISDRNNAYGLVVDKFLGEYDLVVRPLDNRLGNLPDISSVAVMLDGSPVLIFDVEDLLHSINKRLGSHRLRKVLHNQDNEQHCKRILVADDSITIRELERKLLEQHGYQVDVAVDGMDAWNALHHHEYDLLVSDIDMPRLDGIGLIQRLREQEAFQYLPVVVVSYKDTEEHRLQGMRAGANYYLTKSSFEDDSFVQAIVDLIGEATFIPD